MMHNHGVDKTKQTEKLLLAAHIPQYHHLTQALVKPIELFEGFELS